MAERGGIVTVLQGRAPRRRPPATLRTKSGCLTCRIRRKKCDEIAPVCSRCSKSSRACKWPPPEDAGSRGYGKSQAVLGSAALTAEVTLQKKIILCDIEPVIAQHFVDQYYRLIINPESHQDFYQEWISAIQQVLSCHGGVRYSVLSNAASHLYFSDESSSMQGLALRYYSKSMSVIRKSLATNPDSLRSTLTSIMLLYLHGCMGFGTFSDIPAHLSAAILILESHWFGSEYSPILSRPFDRLAVESVLYQVFVVTVDLWSSPMPSKLKIDPAFWERCHQFLKSTTLFPELSNTCNSPVLGVDLDLFRLIIKIKALWVGPDVCLPDVLRLRTEEMHIWDRLSGLFEDDCGPEQNDDQESFQTIADDASRLYMLCASMLIDQLICRAEQKDTSPSESAHGQSWQLHRVMVILRRRQNDANWLSCFIGTWPVYTAGIFARRPEDVAVINHEMQKRWESMRLYQAQRYWNDLKSTWARRSLGMQAAISAISPCA